MQRFIHFMLLPLCYSAACLYMAASFSSHNAFDYDIMHIWLIICKHGYQCGILYKYVLRKPALLHGSRIAMMQFYTVVILFLHKNNALSFRQYLRQPGPNCRGPYVIRPACQADRESWSSVSCRPAVSHDVMYAAVPGWRVLQSIWTWWYREMCHNQQNHNMCNYYKMRRWM